MTKQTDASKNPVLIKHLSVLARCYSSGWFSDLFPLLADDCVFETQWRLEPDTGKDAVMAYFANKGQSMRESNCCPVCDLISFVGYCNPVRNADVTFNGQQHRGTFMLMYSPNKYALRMRQELDGRTNCVIVDLTLNEQDQIRRIDLCMPELFCYRIVQESVR